MDQRQYRHSHTSLRGYQTAWCELRCRPYRISSGKPEGRSEVTVMTLSQAMVTGFQMLKMLAQWTIMGTMREASGGKGGRWATVLMICPSMTDLATGINGWSFD